MGKRDRNSSDLLLHHGHTRATALQFEKKQFWLSYHRKDLEQDYRVFFGDILTPTIRYTLLVTAVLFLIRHVTSLAMYLRYPGEFPMSYRFLVGYGVTGVALPLVFCGAGLLLSLHRPTFVRLIRPVNCLLLLLLGVFPIITSGIFENSILTYSVVIQFYLLLLVYGRFVQIRFVDSLFLGWVLYVYYVAALGVASRNVSPPLPLSFILALILYTALAVVLFNVTSYQQERIFRSTFEVFFTKKQQTEQLMVEINDLRKKTIAVDANAPPDAPLTKALKLLREMEQLGTSDNLPSNLAKQIKEVSNILSSGSLYSPNIRHAVGDHEIGAWLDHMLGEKPEATIRPDSRFRSRASIADSKKDKASIKSNDYLDAATKYLQIPQEVKVTLDEVLSIKDTWEFDVFRLAEITNGHPLLFLAHRIFTEENYLFEFKIPEDVFLAYVMAIESGYRAENPYHNALHGADVLHATYYFLKKAIKKDALSTLEVMASLVGAMVHDYAHPGVNNNFLIKTDHPLALRYNDRSVLENYHAAESLRLMKTPEMNITCGMTASQITSFRSIVMEVVLGTDVSHHFEYLSKFENRVTGGMTPERIEKKEDLMLVMAYTVKCADMSNPARPPDLNRMWVMRVMQEFFEQGDLEREKGLEISMFCDRSKPNIPKCQTGFIDFLVRPMYLKWHNFTQCDATKHTLDLVEENYHFWKSHLDQNGNPLNPQAFTPPPKSSTIDMSHLGRESADDLNSNPVRT